MIGVSQLRQIEPVCHVSIVCLTWKQRVKAFTLEHNIPHISSMGDLRREDAVITTPAPQKHPQSTPEVTRSIRTIR